MPSTLHDGKQKLVTNPLTGELQPWKLTRAYGCNNIIASENLLTFRSGAAGFYDLLTDSGTGNFGGFKSGCTSNLVVANGVLNAPDYTRTCSCAYQNQTSLALVHMPEVETWSISAAASFETNGTRIHKLGVNFGAPGDRRDAEGLLWLEYPVVAGESPPLEITYNPEATPFLHHSSSLPKVEDAWILASGLSGITDLHINMQIPKAQPAENDAQPPADDVAEPTNDDPQIPATPYRVRLFFGSSANAVAAKAGPLVFDVLSQGETVAQDVTLDPAANGEARYTTVTVERLPIGNELHLQFVAKQGTPALSGIEILSLENGERGASAP